MAVCLPEELLEEARCLNCLSGFQLEVARASLLCQWWLILEPDADCSVNSLLDEARCINCTTLDQLQRVISQLFCDDDGGVGSTSFNCVADECVDPGDGSGAFGSLAECQAADCGGISPTEPSFNCVEGSCVDPGDGSGTYATLEECEIACDVTPSWNCVSEGLCVDPGDGTGEFASLIECEEACCEYCGDEFETYALGDVTGDTDLDDGCCWIGAWSLAADPILTAGIEEFTEYPDGPAGVLNGGTGFTDAWVIS